MKPSWTALVSSPISLVVSPQSRARSGADALALNHWEVQNSSATIMIAMARISVTLCVFTIKRQVLEDDHRLPVRGDHPIDDSARR